MTIDPWQLVGALSVMAGAIGWLVRLQYRHTAHEDLCAQRYKSIEATHAQLVKVSDERHQENRERLQSLDEKMDRVLDRL